MKRAVFRLDAARGGWLQTTIAPVRSKQQVRFGLFDALMFLALVAASVGVARLLLAH